MLYIYYQYSEGGQHDAHTSILATVEKGRLQKAVEGFVSSAYTITPTAQTEAEVRGYVANGDGQQYGVVLTADRSFCSCKDSMFRHSICKHAVVLALHVIRTPQAEAKHAIAPSTSDRPGLSAKTARLAAAPLPEERPVNLKLGKVRPGWQACV